MESFFESDRIKELIEQGHLRVVQNEFGEDVLELAESLEDADPEIYDLFTDSFMDLMQELEVAGFVATGFDDEGEQYFYATEFGVEFFSELIRSRATRIKMMQLSDNI